MTGPSASGGAGGVVVIGVVFVTGLVLAASAFAFVGVGVVREKRFARVQAAAARAFFAARDGIGAAPDSAVSRCESCRTRAAGLVVQVDGRRFWVCRDCLPEASPRVTVTVIPPVRPAVSGSAAAS